MATKVLGTKLFPQHNIADLNSGITIIAWFSQEKPSQWKKINIHTNTHTHTHNTSNRKKSLIYNTKLHQKEILNKNFVSVISDKDKNVSRGLSIHDLVFQTIFSGLSCSSSVTGDVYLCTSDKCTCQDKSVFRITLFWWFVGGKLGWYIFQCLRKLFDQNISNQWKLVSTSTNHKIVTNRV